MSKYRITNIINITLMFNIFILGRLFYVFESLAHQGCSYLIKTTLETGILYNIITIVLYFNIFENVIYSYDDKGEFSAVVTPVFSVTWSFRNHYQLNSCAA